MINISMGIIDSGGFSSNQNYTTYIVATGGTVTTSGNDKIHKFTSSGQFIITGIPSETQDVSVLIVGGGQSNTYSGGGGAVVKQLNMNLTSLGTYDVSVAAAGEKSYFNNVDASSGGGYYWNPDIGVWVWTNTYSGSGKTNGAYIKDTGYTPNRFVWGGGGGDSANGQAASSGKAGDGGTGTHSSISGSDVGYGGGGGATYYPENWSTVGSGTDGGGNGKGFVYGGGDEENTGYPATANTGGGGGGGTAVGGAGGSGIVIIRYKYQ